VKCGNCTIILTENYCNISSSVSVVMDIMEVKVNEQIGMLQQQQAAAAAK